MRPFFSASGERMFVAVTTCVAAEVSVALTTFVGAEVRGDARMAGLEETLMLLSTVWRASKVAANDETISSQETNDFFCKLNRC